MFVSITLLRLKSPLKIPMLIRYSGPIFGSISSQGCLSYSSRGIWLNHYTMSVWKSEEDMKKFVHSKEHKEALNNTRKMASSVRFYKAEMGGKPSWKEAYRLLKEQGYGYDIK